MLSLLISLPVSDPILLSLSATLSVYLAQSSKHSGACTATRPDAPGDTTS